MPEPGQLPSGFNGSAFVRLALPMIISRAGLASMGIVDGIMVAHFGPHQYAWLSLAEGTLGRLLDVFCSFLIACLSLVPRHFAQGDSAGARMLWLRTFPVSLVLGALGITISLFGTPLLLLMGQKSELAAGAGPVMLLLGVGHPAGLLAIAAAVYLEGMNRPRFVAFSVITANLLNVLFNWILIGGHFGIAAMGARGSALSTTCVRFALCSLLFTYAWRLRVPANQVPTADHLAERTASCKAQFRLGFGGASTVMVLVVLGSSLTIFAGWLGILPLASYSAALSVSTAAILVAMGMADAAGIYVSSESGRSGEHSAAKAAWGSLRITLIPITIIVFVLTLFPGAAVSIYTKDAAMRAGMRMCIPIVAFILLSDSVGLVMTASLRSLREAVWPASIEIASALLVVPLALAFAFGLGYGIRGLLAAMLTVAVLRAAVMLGRFWWRTHAVAFEPDAPVEELSLNAR